MKELEKKRKIINLLYILFISGIILFFIFFILMFIIGFLKDFKLGLLFLPFAIICFIGAIFSMYYRYLNLTKLKINLINMLNINKEIKDFKYNVNKELDISDIYNLDILKKPNKTYYNNYNEYIYNDDLFYSCDITLLRRIKTHKNNHYHIYFNGRIIKINIKEKINDLVLIRKGEDINYDGNKIISEVIKFNELYDIYNENEMFKILTPKFINKLLDFINVNDTIPSIIIKNNIIYIFITKGKYTNTLNLNLKEKITDRILEEVYKDLFIPLEIYKMIKED